MSDERFVELLDEILYDRCAVVAIARLMCALRHVVSACGEGGADALEEFCEEECTQARLKFVDC